MLFGFEMFGHFSHSGHYIWDHFGALLHAGQRGYYRRSSHFRWNNPELQIRSLRGKFLFFRVEQNELQAKQVFLKTFLCFSDLVFNDLTVDYNHVVDIHLDFDLFWVPRNSTKNDRKPKTAKSCISELATLMELEDQRKKAKKCMNMFWKASNFGNAISTQWPCYSYPWMASAVHLSPLPRYLHILSDNKSHFCKMSSLLFWFFTNKS